MEKLKSAVPFGWIYPILQKGIQGPLGQEDIDDLNVTPSSKLLGTKLESYWRAELWESKRLNRKPSFRRLLFRVFGTSILIYGFLQAVVECGLKILSAVLLYHLIKFYNSEETNTFEYANPIIMAMIIVNFATQFLHHFSFYSLERVGLNIRVAITALIYRKALRLNSSAVQETSVGQLVNILSNDVGRFDKFIPIINYMWIGPIQGIITTALIWKEIGPCCTVGTLLLVSYIPLQSVLGRKFLSYRAHIAERVDQRTKQMKETLASLKIIKMYAWIGAFENLIEKFRRREMKTVLKSNMLRAINMVLFITSTKAATFSMITGLVLLGNSLKPEKVFFMISLINKVRIAMIWLFYNAVSMTSEIIVGINRIQAFLEMEENETFRLNEPLEIPLSQDCVVNLKKVSAKWDETKSRDTLSGITFSIKKGEIMVLMGPVGAGKTSLLLTILQELPSTGSLSIRGRVSYASQVPWLFAGSVRDNVLFGQPYNARRYDEVIKACALEEDIYAMPEGDFTDVGERGSALSGGQAGRINLARAVYRKAELYLLDDPLSAVDSNVQRLVIDNLLSGILSNKAVILVTHSKTMSFEPNYTALMTNGVLQEINKHKICNSGKWNSQILIDIGNSQHSLNKMKNRRGYELPKIEGIVKPRTRIYKKADMNDYDDSKLSKTTKFRTYLRFFRLGGSATKNVIFCGASVGARVGYVALDYWLSFWTKQNAEKFIKNDGNSTQTEQMEYTQNSYNNLYVYIGLFLLFFFSTLLESVLFFSICTSVSRKLHKDMLKCVLHAPMNFFEKVDTGEILNRFTKDINIVDEVLPPALYELVRITLVVAIMVMILYINIWLVIPAFILSIVLLRLRWIYLSSSRDIKLLEGLSRGPIFSHLTSSFDGLYTVRAFQAQNHVIRYFDSFQDSHVSCSRTYLACSRAFGLCLDLFPEIFVTFVALSFSYQTDVSGSSVGLAVSLAMALSGVLQWAIRQSCEADIMMTSVDRALEFTELDHESSMGCQDVFPVDDDENKDSISFQNVSVFYDLSKPPVLRRINFSLGQGQKVGIVGRTGSGKSSLISSLFRLTPYKGRIRIDGVPTNRLCLQRLRESITIIPQTPTLFSGSLRFNLDPMRVFPDEALWKALTEINLAEVVRNLSGQLDHPVLDSGTTFSSGQKQLLSFARALLRVNKIIVLDEATASVDQETDAVIQNLIRTKFRPCTVLAIAHRLQTIMDFDLVLVVQDGTIKEVGRPEELLQDKNSCFYEFTCKKNSN